MKENMFAYKEFSKIYVTCECKTKCCGTDLKEHYQKCVLVEVKCEYCNAFVQKKDMKKHLKDNVKMHIENLQAKEKELDIQRKILQDKQRALSNQFVVGKLKRNRLTPNNVKEKKVKMIRVSAWDKSTQTERMISQL